MTTAFETAFCGRVRQARESAGYSQHELARLLRVKDAAYGRWEIDGLMPHHLILPFCVLCLVSVTWVLGGKEKPHEASAEYYVRPLAN